MLGLKETGSSSGYQTGGSFVAHVEQPLAASVAGSTSAAAGEASVSLCAMHEGAARKWMLLALVTCVPATGRSG